MKPVTGRYLGATLVAAAVICLAIGVTWRSGPKITADAPSSTDAVPPATASMTGARPDRLRPMDGAVITQADTLLENVRIDGRLIIRADNVTLRNVWVETDDYWVVMNYGRNTRIENSTLRGSQNSQAALADFDAGYFLADRLDVSGAADGVRMGSGSHLTASFIHDLGVGGDTHNDAIEISGARDIVVRANVILNSQGQTSCIMMSDFTGSDSVNIMISDNMLAGGGYTIYGGAPVTGVVIERNRFSTRYFPKAGFYGWVSYWSEDGNTWRDNVWADGDRTGQAVRP